MYDKNEVKKIVTENAKKILKKKSIHYMGGEKEETRKVGDKWTDSEGVEWEQKEGYISKISRLPGVGIFDKQCKDCEKNCVKSYDKETHIRMGRCYYCQIDFEVKLKGIKIGNHGNKWQFWVKLQRLRAWDSIDKEIEQYVDEKDKFNKKNPFDMTVANALANSEIDISMGK